MSRHGRHIFFLFPCEEQDSDPFASCLLGPFKQSGMKSGAFLMIILDCIPEILGCAKSHTIARAHTHTQTYTYDYTHTESMYWNAMGGENGHPLLVLRGKLRKMTTLLRMFVRRCTCIQAHKLFFKAPNVREQTDSPPHNQQRIQSWWPFANKYTPCFVRLSLACRQRRWFLLLLRPWAPLTKFCISTDVQ